MLGYYGQVIAFSTLTAQQQGGHHTLAAGAGTFGYVPQVDTLLGFPAALRAGGAVIDVPIGRYLGTASGDTEQRKNLNLQLGILSSALEHTVPEQMFVTPEAPGEAISAVKALAKANALGQRIYHLTPANQAQTLQNIQHDAATLREISAALAVGKEVITHTDAVNVPGWSGAGYIIFDPVTGDGAYKISGGTNGGLINALDATAFTISILASYTQSLANILGQMSAVFGSIANFAGLTAFLIGLIEIIEKCGSYVGQVVATFTYFSLLSGMIVWALTVLLNPLVAFAANTAIGFALTAVKDTLLEDYCR